MKRVSKTIITLSALTLIFACLGLSADAQDRFTGTWKLNRELSDQPADKIVRQNNQRANADTLESAELVREPLLKPFPLTTETLKTSYNDARFRVESEFETQDRLLNAPAGRKLATPVGDDGKPVRLILPFSPVRVFYTDGRVVKRELQPGKTIETKAQRIDSKIVVAEDLPFGGKSLQTFELSPDGNQLFVTFQIENSGVVEKPSPIRFVYDRTDN